MKPWQRPSANTFWRARNLNMVQVLHVLKGMVHWRYVPLPSKHGTTPVAKWNLERVWIGGESDFPKIPSA